MDADGDGQLSAEEFTRAAIEFWSSTDPDAPGNWWMGPPPTRTDRPAHRPPTAR
ncbi:MAG: hypothetical protein JO272_00480 [Pseudonocardiales bacterium]|nr:hypothetical protein [Pseudonocardiales bacterium]